MERKSILTEVPIARRHLFAGLGLLLAAPILPAPAAAAPIRAAARSWSYDRWETGNTSEDGGCTELSQFWVSSKIEPGRKRALWVRIEMSHSWYGQFFCWTTYEKFYDNGVYLGEYGPNWNSAYGPATLYNPSTTGLKLYVTGGGSHRITSRSFEFRGGTVTTNAFDFTIVLPYIITATAGGGGSISSAGDSSVNPGGSKTYTATPSEGYHVSDIKVDGRSQGARASYTFSNVQADHTITASFAINTYTVTFRSGYGGNAVLKTQRVNHGGSATAPNVPGRTGWKFAGWDRGYTNVTSNITVTAKWAGDSKVVYHADGEERYTQGGLTPGSAVSVPAAAKTACARPGCTPGWTGWFSDSACTKRWNGGSVPAGTLRLYSYNEATLSFALTDDSAPMDRAHVEPDASSAAARVLPDPVTVRYGRTATLTLPPPCFSLVGDDDWSTVHAEGFFPDRGGGSPVTRFAPQRDTVLYVRWARAVAEGVEAILGR